MTKVRDAKKILNFPYLIKYLNFLILAQIFKMSSKVQANPNSTTFFIVKVLSTIYISALQTSIFSLKQSDQGPYCLPYRLPKTKADEGADNKIRDWRAKG